MLVQLEVALVVVGLGSLRLLYFYSGVFLSLALHYISKYNSQPSCRSPIQPPSILLCSASLNPRIQQSSNMQRRRQFRVQPLKGQQLRYEGLVDRHLEYFFASKQNRQTLVKTKLVNRRNEIIDRSVCKVIEGEHLQIHNSFRLRKSSSKKRYASVKANTTALAKTVGKKEFQEFLEQQRKQIQRNMPARSEEAIKTQQSQVLPRGKNLQ